MQGLGEAKNSILEQIKEAGNCFYKNNDFNRAIAAYESGLALVTLGTAISISGDNPYHMNTANILPTIGHKACGIVVFFYLNIAQAYLQLSKTSSDIIDPVLAGHAVMTVSTCCLECLLSIH
jgi:hypothetical protein